MDSSNSIEDWYQTFIKIYGIKEITENFGKKERIGSGGTSLVYKTKCESLKGIVVAIKEVNIIPDDYKNSSQKTFRTELKIYNRNIDNERIILFYGINRNVEDNLYYLVLEYANQGNLREFINTKNCNENGFEWRERIRLATQIAEGLCYLHDKLNIAHRDLHTKNILVNDGDIKISDFGLSKNLDSIDTSDNKIVGIIPFIDPQKLNDKDFKLDKSSDIYSLEPKNRPSISDVLTRLKSVSLDSVFEGDDENPIKYLLPPPPFDTSNHFTSEYSSNLSSLYIPDDTNISIKKDISSSTSSFSTNNTWVRTEPVQIILREFRFESTIKNLKLHLEIKNVICCYGFTLNPETKRYYMILKYANYGNFRQYIWKKFPFRWRKRLSILRKIVEDPDPKNRPTTQELLKELHTFTTAPLDRQFECQQQPHGTRPDQLSKTKVKKTIDVITSSSGTISFRFTNKLLNDYKI
ncbi:unnamed protein product [Rhizophagus irregularis]|nr:unnamed protein product [Rhizophagus irregularis]